MGSILWTSAGLVHQRPIQYSMQFGRVYIYNQNNHSLSVHPCVRGTSFEPTPTQDAYNLPKKNIEEKKNSVLFCWNSWLLGS
jgi:hypothetical protein